MPAASPGLPIWTPGVWGSVWESGVWAAAVAPAATTALFSVDANIGGAWTDITSDVVRTSIRHSHGIDGNDPQNVVAGSGELSFDLKNFAEGSRPVGYYSPGHANVRAGWGYGIDVRVVYDNGTEHTRWIGKISEIDPDPNPHGSRSVHVVAYDYQHNLIETDVRSLDPAVGLAEDTLLHAVFDAMPVDAQPLSRSLASGLDVVPFAFDKVGSNTKAATVINDLMRSAFGIQYTSADGVATYKTRQTRFTSPSIATLTDADHVTAFSGPTSRQGSYNCVRVTLHPKCPIACTLWEFPDATPQVIYPGQTLPTIETYYRDPDQTSTPIGASSITAPVAGTDYIATEFADGTGLTLTGDLTVVATSFATYTKWDITNTGTLPAYLTTWQIRGTGLFDDADQCVEARSTQPYGERVLSIDAPYQNNPHVAYGMADLIRTQRENPTTIPRQVSFIANRSSTLMTLAMTADVGDVIALSNAQTGVSSATCAIQRIAFEHVTGTTQGGTTGAVLRVTYGLAPTSTIAPPSAPTGLSVSVASDTSLTPTWTNTDATAETELYVNGVFWAVAAAGATSATLSGLTRATNYTITAKHLKYALLRSSATAGVVARPIVVATGGTITTDGTYEYHAFYTSGTFTITKPGRINMALVGGGGGGGGSNAVFIAGGGGGGGEVFQALDNIEPANPWSVVIGAGGAGAVSGVDLTGADGGNTTYRSQVALGGGGGGSYVVATGGNHNGDTGGCGGGGSGEGGNAGGGNLGYAGGAGGIAGSGYRTGGGGGGMGSVGGAGVQGTSIGTEQGGAAGTSITVFGNSVSAGGQGGGPGSAHGADGSQYGAGGHGNLNGDGGDGYQGFAVFWFLI